MAIQLSDLAGKPWRCEKIEFGSPKRGTLDFTNHIDTASGKVTDAPYKEPGGGSTHKLSGEAKVVGTTASFQLSDNSIVLVGVVFHPDPNNMQAVVSKHQIQPLVLTDQEGIKHRLLEQVDEPWVITKP